MQSCRIQIDEAAAASAAAAEAAVVAAAAEIWTIKNTRICFHSSRRGDVGREGAASASAAEDQSMTIQSHEANCHQ